MLVGLSLQVCGALSEGLEGLNQKINEHYEQKSVVLSSFMVFGAINLPGAGKTFPASL